MSWWQALLTTSVPALVAITVGLLTWRSLHRQQNAAARREQAQADSLDIGNLEELRSQVNTLWQERNDFRDRLAAALDRLADATGDITRLRVELDRARERIELLEREVLRLGGNPLALNGGK